ncbi:2-amino-4-hydroxy-6-hydroxymethyldihydropteridine diphosphokinase [Aromatoleum aromaticum]|uniref:2-amino-4-hydroxy-6-hydroxymethyldihydropteridine pyrophosphokinase n=1 Tax=Aromatoleum aromaticum (strain DSM 19018 / LMG 30748 / EbN1) TaxID=76114 RepID=Q5NXQ5_AROAE|nr:2-amino-4-hydroxy-6-hydroxymethyldihydropteridine diphosphokinase [Aromatoleum aromaticum]NMG54507.1 2-amino-4-hydroxy-6-hydroxymethyldihydropteridine diphosphokinase [Aromatoleum aromaticum]CAI10159.1 7,8-dihydro-6-hydroxymethylpterin-pyrophosphokin ase [Aromatoleum aromaticum EbN1]
MKRSGPGRTGATHAPVRAFVALGSNLGQPVATLRTAFEALDRLPDTRVVARSALYRTAPVGVRGQPDFFNAVAALDTALPARALLDALFAIEAQFGRTRAYPQAPRTLDLDLLLYDDGTVTEPGLEIPHPRMHLRAFVLVPLAEIAPAATIPGRGRVADLLPGVRDQTIERLPD